MTMESTYASGGGGVSLEHAFGATALVALLTGDSIPELGDGFAFVRVTFQASRFSAVDDFVVTGRRGPGDERTVAAAVRRRPRIAPKDDKFVEILDDMLSELDERGSDIDAGLRRLLLAVGGSSGPARQLAALASNARQQQDRAGLDLILATRAAPLRQRLELLEAAIEETRQGPLDTRETTFRLLRGLYVREVFLEEPDTRDRTASIARLLTIAPSLEEATSVWAHLCELAAGYGPGGADVDEAMLRRDLADRVRVGPSYRHQGAVARLEELSSQLDGVVRHELGAGPNVLTLPRTDSVREVQDAIESGPITIVRGEPDTGKSAVAKSAADRLRERGGLVYALRLPDLPSERTALSAFFGAPVRDAFGGSGTAARRVLLVDGAEAVQAGFDETLGAVATAAIAAGFAIVAVARDDAHERVAEVLRAAGDANMPAPREVVVPGLSDPEIDELLTAFPGLAPMALDTRSRWLLARLGLVDLLLRGGSIESLGAGAFSEADVLTAVWRDLVRNREQHEPGGATPEGRQELLLDLAASALGLSASTAHDGTTLESLRGDGLVAPVSPTRPWSVPTFASDLVRDFAVAVTLRRAPDGIMALARANAPRWAVRAARVAVQVLLADAPLREEARRTAQANFDEIADTFGDRWTDVPWEAVLLLGDRDALADAWPSLAADDHAELRRVLRLVDQRFTSLGRTDPRIAGPLAALVVEHGEDLLGGDDDLRDGLLTFVRSWLLGLLRRDASGPPDATRQSFRELLLSQPLRKRQEQLELLGALGSDVDVRVIEELRTAAAERPDDLSWVVEELGPRMSLAIHQPTLLVELAERYYVKQDRPAQCRDPWAGDMDYLHGRGLRGHVPRGVLGIPLFAPWLGPFRELLATAPIEALEFINRMLDHATRAAIARNEVDVDAAGIELDLAGLGPRTYIGNGDSWGWYRAVTVGPYPAMSALIAVEDWADQMLAAGLTMARVIRLLLNDCHSLGMVALVTGILTRHLEMATLDLDTLLAEPVIWHLEFSRVVHEGGLLGRHDDENRAGIRRRRYTPRDTAIELVMGAVLRGDGAREQQLRSVGARLDEAATRIADPKEAAAMRTWAGGFRREQYEPSETNGGIQFAYRPPPDAAETLASDNEDLNRGREGWRLQHQYSIESTPVDAAALVGDIAIAQDLTERPPVSGPTGRLDGPAAVASAAIRAQAERRVVLSDKDLAWSLEVLCEAVESSPEIDEWGHGRTRFIWGGDRCAAAALPLLLLPELHSALSARDLDRVGTAVRRLFRGPIDEVRRIAAATLAVVWQEPCRQARGTDRCFHEVALEIALDGTRDARLGPYGEQVTRDPDPFDGPLETGLASIGPGDMHLDRLASPVLAATSAARSYACVAEHASTALRLLLTAHLRVAPEYARQHYDTDEAEREAFAAGLLYLAAAGHSELLDAHIEALLFEPRTVATMLDDMLRLATYQAESRADLRVVWPSLMVGLLDRYDSGALKVRSDWLREGPIAEVVPAPQGRMGDDHIDQRLDGLTGDWVRLDEIADSIDRWLGWAAGLPRCVDALVGFVRTLPIEDQVARGLPWTLGLVHGHGSTIAGRTYLVVEWLEDLRKSGRIGHARAIYQQVVDSLAAGGDGRAARLQALEE